MEILKKMIKDREDNQAGILAKKLDKLWVKKQKEKDAKVKKMRAENIKSILFFSKLKMINYLIKINKIFF